MDEMRMMDEMLSRPGEEILEGAWQHIARDCQYAPGRYALHDLQAMVTLDACQQACWPAYPFAGARKEN